MEEDIVFSVKTDFGGAASGVQADALVLIVSEEDVQRSRWTVPGLAECLRPLTERGLFKGEAGQTGLYPTYGLLPAAFLLLAGTGKEPAADHAWREAGAAAAREAEKHGLERLALGFGAAEAQAARVAEPGEAAGADAGGAQRQGSALLVKRAALLAEGIVLGAFRIRSYRGDAAPSKLREVICVTDAAAEQEPALLEALKRAKTIASAVNYARHLTNVPGNLLTPELLAEEARMLAAKYELFCEILGEEEILRRGMGGLYHVGKGSVHPPRMIVLKYQGRKDWDRVLGLVGKGITFDTGGISLKKPAGMEEMISDMGGAAVLLGVMQALAELRPAVNVLVVIPSAENMPSGGALKPGDIITMLSGKTVEVLNTDAEGRIVLGDGVTYALELGAERIIDVATLTGAVLVSFGDVATGAVANDDGFWAELASAADRSGEKVWRLPAYPEYQEALKSPVADLKNSGFANGWASAITAGLFIGAFAEKTPWIHLDTGGTAWLWSERGLHPKGGTGAMVPTLVEMLAPEGD